MSTRTHDLQVGDSVRVRDGLRDEETGIDIGGWQGRIAEVDRKKNLVLVNWDSVVLHTMPDGFIVKCEQEGLGWNQYYLRPGDVEPVPPRDREEDVEEAVEEIQAKFTWAYLGPEGERINEILAGIDPDDEWEMYERWEEYLGRVLTFPFRAEVTEPQHRGPFQSGDVVVVHEIFDTEDLYGLIVRVKKGRKTFYFPLCDLTPLDQNSSNYQPVRDYAIWFANR